MLNFRDSRPTRFLERIGEKKKEKGEQVMPNYEFQCQNCKKKYAVPLSLKEREERKYKCPKCGSRKSQPVFGGFYVKTSKKS
jgi:putative FmdB family regulatory protein